MNQKLVKSFLTEKNYKYWIFYDAMKEYESNEVEHMRDINFDHQKMNMKKLNFPHSWRNKCSGKNPFIVF